MESISPFLISGHQLGSNALTLPNVASYWLYARIVFVTTRIRMCGPSNRYPTSTFSWFSHVPPGNGGI